VLDIRPLLERALARPAAAPVAARLGIGRIGVQPAAATAETATRPLLTFEVAGQEYALDLDRVEAIVDMPADLAAVPRADGAVLGLAMLRDVLLPVLSLRALLGRDAAQGRSGAEKVIIATIAGQAIGLLADRVRAVLRADAATIEAAPPLLAARAGGEARLAAVHRRPGGAKPVPILAPDQLFRDDVMQRLDGPRTGTAPAPAGSRGDEKAFLVFRLGDEEFGLPVEAVVEVAAAPEQVTRIPKTPKFLEGVVNLRGDVVPVIDQRRRFELPPSPDPRRRRLVVLRTGRYRAALIVDGVREVLRVAAGAIAPGPDIAQEATRLVSGVANLERDGRLVLLLDPEELLTRSEQRLLDNFAAIRPGR
jgi:purine-binding chemotaxis protein CheW